MDKYLKIENNGLLEVGLISLMGGTTKDNDNSKIGQWGSGLKYATSFFIKNNIDFVIFVDNKKIKFTTKQEIYRNETFNVIYINGQRTSITQKMGGDAWSEWQAIREIWSNALDESGKEAKYSLVDSREVNIKNDETRKGKTVFYIKATPKIIEVYNDWNEYFIDSNKIPFYENSEVKLYCTNSKNLKIYKQGILIKNLEVNNRCLFSYDIADAPINELRELRGSSSYLITTIFREINDAEVIDYILNSMRDSEVEDNPYYENTLSYEYDWDFLDVNDTWKKVIGNSKIIHKEALNKLKGTNPNVEQENDLFLVPKNLYYALVNRFKNISLLKATSLLGDVFEIYDYEFDNKIKQALAILESCNYYINPELKIIICDFGANDVLGQINRDTKEINLSIKLKDFSLADLVATIIEENEHYVTGYSDCTRDFQTHFIKMYSNLLLKTNEIKL